MVLISLVSLLHGAWWRWWRRDACMHVCDVHVASKVGHHLLNVAANRQTAEG